MVISTITYLWWGGNFDIATIPPKLWWKFEYYHNNYGDIQILILNFAIVPKFITFNLKSIKWSNKINMDINYLSVWYYYRNYPKLIYIEIYWSSSHNSTKSLKNDLNIPFLQITPVHLTMKFFFSISWQMMSYFNLSYSTVYSYLI